MKTLTETIKQMGRLQEQDPALDPQNDGEYNDEGGMAITQLKTAQDAVNDLMQIIQKDDNLPEWVQSKLTKAVDYMDSVRDYLSAEFTESRAARDARKAAKSDPDMRAKGFDKDVVATPDDIAKISKNIIVQLKKASDVKGNREIEFADGKKKKIKPEILDKLLKVFMQIQKPRDKEKFQQMIAKSERDMMNIVKKLGASYNAEELEEMFNEEVELDEKFDVTVTGDIDKNQKQIERELKTYKGKYAGAVEDDGVMFTFTDQRKADGFKAAIKRQTNDVFVEDIELDEGFSPKEIKMAIGIASDKRYAGGNMTGAVNAIEKIKKGLSKHKQVAAVLKRQNEDLNERKYRPEVLDKVLKIMNPTKSMSHAIPLIAKGMKVSEKEAEQMAKAVMKRSLGEDYDITEDYFTVIYRNKSGKVEAEKDFKDKKKADAYAEKGNSIDKVGGSYTVTKVKGKMESVTEEAEMDYDKMFEEAFEPKSLEDVVSSIVLGEAQSGDKEAYQKFFKATMKKFGVSSPGELSGEKEKEFYDYIDKNWKGDNEKAESADGDGKESHSEVGKSGKKMKVKMDPEIEESKQFFNEKEMTDAQMKKREEIVKELKKKEADFKEKYGDRAKEVMYATATKMAMKS